MPVIFFGAISIFKPIWPCLAGSKEINMHIAHQHAGFFVTFVLMFLIASRAICGLPGPWWLGAHHGGLPGYIFGYFSQGAIAGKKLTNFTGAVFFFTGNRNWIFLYG